jgi:hypothetical protein
MKALPPFKWKPIDFWLVYTGDNHITSNNTQCEFSKVTTRLYLTLQGFVKVLKMLQ